MKPRTTAGLAVVAVAVAFGLAACGGSSSSRQVASPSNSAGHGSRSGHGSGAVSSAATSLGNPTRLLDEWAACLRRHGDAGQADPTINADQVIRVIIPLNAPKGVMASSGAHACDSYLTAASMALRGGAPAPTPDPAKQLKFSECMRAKVPDFPDPSAGGGISLNGGGDLSPNNPTLQNAAKVCAKETGGFFPGAGAAPPGTILVQTQAAIDSGLAPGGNG